MAIARTTRLSRALMVSEKDDKLSQSSNSKQAALSKDEEEAPKTRKTIIRNKSDNVWRIIEQISESYESLKSKIKALKEENKRLRSKLKDEAEISLQLKDENQILLDKLRHKYPPDVIASLEAENPD